MYMDIVQQRRQAVAAQMLECALLTGEASTVTLVVQRSLETLPPLSLEALIGELHAIMAEYQVMLSSLDLLKEAANPRYSGLRSLLWQVLSSNCGTF